MHCDKCGKEITNKNSCKCQDISLDQLDQSIHNNIVDTNQLRMIFNIFATASLVLAIGFTTISFILEGISQICIIIFAVLFYIAFFVCNKMKRNKLKKK